MNRIDDHTFRWQVIDWLRANGINTADAANEAPQIVDGQLIVRMRAYTTDGALQADPVDHQLVLGTMTVPLTVEPSPEIADWLTQHDTIRRLATLAAEVVQLRPITGRLTELVLTSVRNGEVHHRAALPLLALTGMDLDTARELVWAAAEESA